jgi:hypothetical protein
MKKHFYTIVFSILSLSLFSQNIPKNSNSVHTSQRIILQQEEYVQLSDDLFQKVLSGKLLEKISAKKYQLKKGEITQSESLSKVVIYFEDEPQETQKTVLEDDGVICYWETWTPPMKNHPYGFVLAELPVEKFEVTLSKNFVKKMDTAEYEAQEHLKFGTPALTAPVLKWAYSIPVWILITKDQTCRVLMKHLIIMITRILTRMLKTLQPVTVLTLPGRF